MKLSIQLDIQQSYYLAMEKKELEDHFAISSLGFLPERCVKQLPIIDDPWFREIEQIADNLPLLNQSTCLADMVAELHVPPLGITHKLNEFERRRLYVILGMIVHSLVNGRDAKWNLLKDEALCTDNAGNAISGRI